MLTICVLAFSCGLGVRPFDSNQPDTKNNNYHYEQLTRVNWTDDVEDLYAFGVIDIDCAFYLSFKCNSKTAQVILDSNNLELDTDKGSVLSIRHQYEWWNENEIEDLPRYIFSNPSQTYFKYFWRNEETGQSYFLDFDL